MPFAWRSRLGFDGPLLRVVVRKFSDSVLAFYKRRCGEEAGVVGQSAATRAGAIDERGREALLKYVLRPPIARERVGQAPEGLGRIALKKRFSDGTFAVDLDALAAHAPLRFGAATEVP